MDLISIIFIAIGLAMDAFAVSVSSGLVISDVKLKDSLKIALCFGLFQAAMPLLGWILGGFFSNYIVAFDHWIAFLLLLYLGVNMIRESRNEETVNGNILEFKTLILMGIATSIDAFIIGVNFAFMNLSQSLITAVSIIGIVTFVLSLIGVFFGKKFGQLIGQKAEVAGGIVLILIGIKTLAEHLFF